MREANEQWIKSIEIEHLTTKTWKCSWWRRNKLDFNSEPKSILEENYKYLSQLSLVRLIAVHEAWIHMSKYTKAPLKITRTHRVIGININDYSHLSPSCCVLFFRRFLSVKVFSSLVSQHRVENRIEMYKMCLKYPSSMDLIASVRGWNLHQWWFRWEISRVVECIWSDH